MIWSSWFPLKSLFVFKKLCPLFLDLNSLIESLDIVSAIPHLAPIRHELSPVLTRGWSLPKGDRHGNLQTTDKCRWLSSK